MLPSRRALTTALEAARAALGRGDRSVLATQLRESWRATRAPLLAELYEQLAGCGPSQSERVLGATAQLRAEAFRALAQQRPGDPLVLPALLADPWNSELDEVERLRLLAQWTPDPRLASSLTQRLRLPFVPDWAVARAQVRSETVRLLAAQQDPRQLDTLERLAAKPGHPVELRRQLRGAIASLGALDVFRLDPRTASILVPLQRRASELRASEAEGHALLAAIHSAPADDAARLIYADWLESHGDPRGEFIALQLRHGGSLASEARVHSLLDTHGSRWAGALHGVLNPRTRVFERGFLSRASIEARELEGAILEAPEWATLRSLDGHVPPALLLRAPLHGLRELYGFLSLEHFLALRAAGRLQSVLSYECSIADPNFEFDTPLGLDALLVRAALDPQLRALLASPAVSGLEQLGLYYLAKGQAWAGDHRERPGLRARIELLRRHLPDHISRVRMLDERSSRASAPEGCELLFERGAQGAPLARLQLRLHRYANADPRRSLVALAGVLEDLAPLGLESLGLAHCDSGIERDAALALFAEHREE